MARTQAIGVREQMTSLIQESFLRELAHDTDVTHRRRKVDMVALFWTVMLGFCTSRERSLAGLRRLHEKDTRRALARPRVCRLQDVFLKAHTRTKDGKVHRNYSPLECRLSLSRRPD